MPLADPKPLERVKDPKLLGTLHLTWKECVLCEAVFPLTLHHISKHPRDDVIGNLVMLCGSGTTGCHGLVEARDEKMLTDLGRYIREFRRDTIVYLHARKGASAAQAWMRLNLLIGS